MSCFGKNNVNQKTHQTQEIQGHSHPQENEIGEEDQEKQEKDQKTNQENGQIRKIEKTRPKSSEGISESAQYVPLQTTINRANDQKQK